MSSDYQVLSARDKNEICLNPFGTGQCLPTFYYPENPTFIAVSIPLEQGSVFRLLANWAGIGQLTSQSLWNRAVSSDRIGKFKPLDEIVSIPLEQGSVFRLQWYFEALWHKAYESHFPTFSETQRVGS